MSRIFISLYAISTLLSCGLFLLLFTCIQQSIIWPTSVISCRSFFGNGFFFLLLYWMLCCFSIINCCKRWIGTNSISVKLTSSSFVCHVNFYYTRGITVFSSCIFSMHRSMPAHRLCNHKHHSMKRWATRIACGQWKHNGSLFCNVYRFTMGLLHLYD